MAITNTVLQAYNRITRTGNYSQHVRAHALRILESGAYRWNGDVLVVASESNPGQSYGVNGSCPCPGWTKFGRCAHRVVKDTLTEAWEPFDGLLSEDRTSRHSDAIALDNEDPMEVIGTWKSQRQAAARRLVYG